MFKVGKNVVDFFLQAYCVYGASILLFYRPNDPFWA